MSDWPYNTRAWRKLRRLVLAERPWCRYCEQAGELRPADTVDHTVPVREAPDRAFDRSNLQPLCASCHSTVKQSEDVRGYSSMVGADGWPVDDRHPVYQDSGMNAGRGRGRR